MTRDEFAAALGIPLDKTPRVPAYPGVTWQMMFDNACRTCKTFTLRGTFPILHLWGCPEQERGLEEGLKQILGRVQQAQNATQDDYEERS